MSEKFEFKLGTPAPRPQGMTAAEIKKCQDARNAAQQAQAVSYVQPVETHSTLKTLTAAAFAASMYCAFKDPTKVD